MVIPYNETPRTEAGEMTRLTQMGDLDFSIEPSFQSPSKDRNDLLKQMRGARGTGLRTPRSRAVLGDVRNPPAQNEFTPLLKSATRNRKIRRDGELKDGGTVGTPATLKAGYKSESPALPEASALYGEHSLSSVMDPDGTSIPLEASSSALSTPRPTFSQRGDGVLEGGNMITLREQEAKLEQIDKENFGLKLKIHFLEENLNKTGSEFKQATIRENTELKVDKVTLQQELKKYRKNLSRAEDDLVQYRSKLQEYAEKVRQRHADQGTQETLEELKRVAEERATELESLRNQLNSAKHTDAESEKLHDEIGDLEAALREKERVIDSKEEELESLREKLEHGAGGDGTDLDDRNRELEERNDELNEELDQLRDQLREMSQQLELGDHEKFESLRVKLEFTESERDQNARMLEEKNDEVKKLERHLQLIHKEKVEEVQALEDRLSVAESSGSNQVQLAQQAIRQATEEARRVKRERDTEVESMRMQVEAFDEVQERLEECRRELRQKAKEANQHKEVTNIREEELGRLRAKLTEREEELRHAQNVQHERDAALEELETLRLSLRRRESELEVLRNTADEPDSQLEAAHQIVRERDEDLDALQRTLQEQSAKFEAIQKTADDRLQSLNALREEMLTTKQMLEDEIQIWETDFHDVEEQKRDLQEQVKRMGENLDTLQDMQKKLDAADSEKLQLQREKVALRGDISKSDREKAGLQAQIDKLTEKLESAQRALDTRQSKDHEYKTSSAMLEAAKREAQDSQQQAAENAVKLAECEAQLKQQLKLGNEPSPSSPRVLRELLKSATLEKEQLQLQAAGRDRELEASIQELKRTVRDKDKKIRAAQQDAQRSATLELLDLKEDMMDKEKRHASELRGLAKQIQYLRAKCHREEGFRESLAYSKRFFLMQIEMYNACNEADLRLIEEMGITPDESIRQKKHCLRTVALMVVASIRMKKMQVEWAANKKLHETLLRKLDQVRRQAKKPVLY